MQSKKKSNSKRAIVEHHILYATNGVGNHQQEEIKVPIFSSEHYILTQLQRRGKVVSKGFLDSLRYFIWERETTNKYFDIEKEEIGGE